MLSTRRMLIAVGLGVLVAMTGCKTTEPTPPLEEPPNYSGEMAPGQKALVKLTDPSLFPDFSEGYDHQTGLEQAGYYSLEYLSKPSSQQYFPHLDITHARAVASVEALIDVLRSARSGQELDAMIKERFDIYQSRGYPDTRTNPPSDSHIVLYTSYYRPIFDARMQPDHEFRYPLYRQPPDLTLNEDVGRYERDGGGAYDTRSQIAHGILDSQGLELCYVRDRFEAYIITVQGSARLRMADGTFFDIGYDADNGHEYTSVGQRLVETGRIDPMELSLQGLIRFFRENPDELDAALAVNDRYVFFTPRGGGPFGSLNVPVTPYRSIATDNDVYPRAGVAFLQTQIPGRSSDGTIRGYSYKGFAMDQDTGGAVRAAGRCDLFLGTGPEVGELAGRTFAEGKLYYIDVKENGPGSAEMASPEPEWQPDPEPGR